MADDLARGLALSKASFEAEQRREDHQMRWAIAASLGRRPTPEVIDLTDDEPRRKKPREEPPRRPPVIGISGCSRSGKSTLAQGLGAIVVHLDHFHPGGRPSEWEVTETSIKLPQAIAAVDAAINHGKLVIIEGFRAFAFEQLVSRMTLCLWLDVPRDVCKDRRRRTRKDPAGHFERYLWPNHQKYEAQVLGRPPAPLVRFDGTRDPSTLRNDAMIFVKGIEAIACVRRCTSRKIAVVTLCGSLCPMTLGHLAMLKTARDFLKKRQNFDVIGLITLNSDWNVKEKLNTDALAYPKRRELVDLTIQDEAWITVEGHGHREEGKSLPALRRAFPGHTFHHYLLNGADDVVKYDKVKRYRSGASTVPQSPMICIGRPGSTVGVRDLVTKYDVRDNFFIAEMAEEFSGVSSTEARRILKSTASPEQKRTRLANILHPSVADACISMWASDGERQYWRSP